MFKFNFIYTSNLELPPLHPNIAECFFVTCKVIKPYSNLSSCIFKNYSNFLLRKLQTMPMSENGSNKILTLTNFLEVIYYFQNIYFPSSRFYFYLVKADIKLRNLQRL